MHTSKYILTTNSSFLCQKCWRREKKDINEEETEVKVNMQLYDIYLYTIYVQFNSLQTKMV